MGRAARGQRANDRQFQQQANQLDTQSRLNQPRRNQGLRQSIPIHVPAVGNRDFIG
jgi:hypothetical protein